MKRFAAGYLLLLMLVLLLGPAAARHDYSGQDRERISSPPDETHWLGTDSLGRDNFARFLYGGRLSVSLSILAALAACLVAALIGTSGALGGSTGQIASSGLFDIMLSTPWYVLVFLVRALMPLDVSAPVAATVTFAVLSFAGWAPAARNIRDAVMAMTQRAWLRQSVATGSFGVELFRGHILPNLWPILTTQFLLLLPVLLLEEAMLGMLGLGIPEPLPSWGGSLVELVSAQTIRQRPWALIPALLLAFTAISLRIQAAEEAK